MNNFWKAAFLLGAFVAAAQCLICHHCSDGKYNVTCPSGLNVTCKNAESCYIGEKKINATFTQHVHGCMGMCEKKLNDNIQRTAFSSSVKVTKCCKTDLCNGATSVQLSLTAALCAAVLSSLWGLWE